MVEGKSGSRGDSRPSANPHAEFLELCALSTTTTLSEEERKKLNEHLSACSECREAAKEFQKVVENVIPAVAEDLGAERTAETFKNDSTFNPAAAEASFLKRLGEGDKRRADLAGEADGWLSPLVVRRSRNFRRSIERVHFWLPLAAAIVLCASLGILTYRMGKHKGVDVTRQAFSNLPRESLSQEALAAVQERDAARARLSDQDRVIASLKRDIAQRGMENAKLKILQSEQQIALQTNAEEKSQLSAERARLAQALASGEAALQVSEQKLRNLEGVRAQTMIQTASLTAQVAELSRVVTEQEKDIAKEKELLTKDKDIRELMGARDLYVAEVIDVEQTGETQKAFGRVFYTKGKSLVFYAYDVDEKPGWKNVNTIQAWGMRGPDQQQAVNLGMFYEDNLTKKRWVLKFNDPKTLSQIDGVFVTLEPHGGSQRPSQKPFMFAYLKMDPNHP